LQVAATLHNLELAFQPMGLADVIGVEPCYELCSCACQSFVQRCSNTRTFLHDVDSNTTGEGRMSEYRAVLLAVPVKHRDQKPVLVRLCDQARDGFTEPLRVSDHRKQDTDLLGQRAASA
jgi:hypothetical protein